ncbi:hypothetical protein [Enterovibrio norvegicus]|uniref:hypothetical protein n=1 Tax=Enterovibrio norvegicus TaxID=188144 RepID=UPI000C85267B|nr:hypothetical protein [Enterovibrio norvegicus]PMN69178.1 hypothetical protein BCT27_04355 [Enterovibrio norvegicus]
MRDRKLYKYLGLMLTALTIIIVLPIIFYIHNVSEELSSTSEHWGNFGSYLSGTISSIVGSLSLLAIVFTIHIQINENRSNTYYHRRGNYINSIDMLINRQRENFSFDEMTCELEEKNSELQAEFMKIKKSSISNLDFEVECKANSFKYLSKLHKTKLEYLGFLDELILLKNEIYLIEGENTKEMDNIYKSGISRILNASIRPH